MTANTNPQPDKLDDNLHDLLVDFLMEYDHILLDIGYNTPSIRKYGDRIKDLVARDVIGPDEDPDKKLIANSPADSRVNLAWQGEVHTRNILRAEQRERLRKGEK